MNIKLKIWRQKNGQSAGGFEDFEAECLPEMSFLEVIDVVNDALISSGKEPIAFEHDCREGICGSCGAMVNGRAHGPGDRTTLCQLHMRKFKDGDQIVVEPWRAEAFPVLKDLIVDRSALDSIIQAGGYISVRTGTAPDAHVLPIEKALSDSAMDAAECIGCGACVGACPNASASLFTAAKIAHLGSMPQGQVERSTRVRAMVEAMDSAGFGHCTNHGECEAACPKGVSVSHISRMNRDYWWSQLFAR